MKSRKIMNIIFIFILSSLLFLSGCSFDLFSTTENVNPNNNTRATNQDASEITDTNTVKDITYTDTVTHNYVLTQSENNTYYFSDSEDENDNYSFSVILESGVECITVSDNLIKFGNVSEDTSYIISGKFYGSIEIDPSDDYKFELGLSNFELYSSIDTPINILSGDKVSIVSKVDTINYIYDLREEVSDEGIKSAIYSIVDLDIKGRGTLYLKSEYNNGIHTKDDLTIKNLTLQVDSIDNSLKGNDSVTIESGNVTLISREGDAIKTTNSHLSDNNKQKGDVTLLSGNILIYAARDGIDASHDIYTENDTDSLNVQIFTDKYSKYTGDVKTEIDTDVIYIRFTSSTYKYSLEFSGDGKETVYYNSNEYTTKTSSSSSSSQYGGFGGRGSTTTTYYYYKIDKPVGYEKVRLFIYSSSQTQGQTSSYVAKTDYLTINDSYDTLALTNNYGGLRYGWTDHNTLPTQTNTGGMGPGGMNDGNSDKADYSSKGLKSCNEIKINGGSLTISSYDDAIHTNKDVLLGEDDNTYYGTGNIYIESGIITISSNDDGVHADGILNVNNGVLNIINSYEGLEGTQIYINNGNVSIVSKDDGINATTTSGVGLYIKGGYLYVYAGGDGLDSNSKSSYSGFSVSGGHTVVISTGSADSALDTENGYSYTSGYLVSIGRSGGMSNESTKCQNFSSIATSKTISLSSGSSLIVSDYCEVKMPVAMSSFVVVLGKTNASISSTSSSQSSVDSNGVLWMK